MPTDPDHLRELTTDLLSEPALIHFCDLVEGSALPKRHTFAYLKVLAVNESCNVVELVQEAMLAEAELPDSVEVFVSTVVSTKLFYAQCVSRVDDLTALQEQLNLVGNTAAILAKPSVFDRCLSLHEKQWCRAQVQSCGEELLYVDYGIRQALKDATEIRELPESARVEAPFARACQLKSDTDEDMLAILQDAYASPIRLVVVQRDVEPLMVELEQPCCLMGSSVQDSKRLKDAVEETKETEELSVEQKFEIIEEKDSEQGLSNECAIVDETCDTKGESQAESCEEDRTAANATNSINMEEKTGDNHEEADSCVTLNSDEEEHEDDGLSSENVNGCVVSDNQASQTDKDDDLEQSVADADDDEMVCGDPDEKKSFTDRNIVSSDLVEEYPAVLVSN